MRFGQLSDKQLGEALGISRQAAARHRKRGCPCHSADAARAWYQSHVDLARSRRRAPFSPCRVEPVCIDAWEDAEQEAEHVPAPVRLDNYPENFWGNSAIASIANVLSGGDAKAWRSAGNMYALFNCAGAAQRRHLHDMPRIMAARIVGLTDTDAVEAELMEWAATYAQCWYGSDFETQPMVPVGLDKLSDWFVPFKGGGK